MKTHVFIGKVNTTELIQEISQETGLEKSTVEKVTNQVFGKIQGRLLKGEKTLIRGFGTFSTVKQKARRGRNPQTGEEVKIPRRTSPKFSFSESFSDKVRGKNKTPKTATASRKSTKKATAKSAVKARTKTSAKTTKPPQNDKWLYVKEGKPSQKYYTVNGLKRLNISPDTLVWNETMTEWKPASKVKALKDLFPSRVKTRTTKGKPSSKPPAIPV